MQPTTRGWIHTGYTCNQQCDFCSYRDSLDKGDKSTKQVKAELSRIRKLGMDQITFSGGEVTIRNDCLELIGFAKSLGYNDIMLITNGIKTSDREYLASLQQAGLTTIQFSLEGYNKETHDKITKGNYNQLLRSYQNSVNLGLNIRINITISKQSCQYLDKIAEKVVELNPSVCNLLTYFGYDDAGDNFKKNAPKYSEIKSVLEASLKILEPIKEVNVRYMPFCIVPEYNRLISGYHQKLYQEFEWNNITADIIKHNRLVNIFHLIMGLIVFKNKKRMLSLPFNNLMNEAMVEYIIKTNFSYARACKKCKYHYICN